MPIEQGFQFRRWFRVLRFFSRDGRLRRSGGGSERFESFGSGRNGGGGGGSVNDVIGDGVAASTADFLFDFMDGSAALVELLCVGVVPTRETELRGRSFSGRVVVNEWGKYG